MSSERNFSLYEVLGDALGKLRGADRDKIRESILTDFSKEMDIASELPESASESQSSYYPAPNEVS